MPWKIKIKRHPAAIAWDKWVITAEGMRASTPYDGVLERPYLENRLNIAFQAGWAAAEKHFTKAKR